MPEKTLLAYLPHVYSPPVGLDLDGGRGGRVVEERPVVGGVPLVVVVVGASDRQVQLFVPAVVHVFTVAEVSAPVVVASVLL